MPALNKFEFGKVLRVNMGEAVNTNIGLKFILQPKTGTPKNQVDSEQYRNAIIRDNTEGVAVGTSNVIVGEDTFLANQYLTYTVKEDDLNIGGSWRMRGEAKLTATNNVISDYQRLTVFD